MAKTRVLYLEKKTGPEIVTKYNSMQENPQITIKATQTFENGRTQVGNLIFDAFIYYEVVPGYQQPQKPGLKNQINLVS